MSLKARLASLTPRVSNKKNDQIVDSSKKGDNSQTFVVIIYRDQDLYIYLVRDSAKSFNILNFIKLKIASLVVGQDQVLRVNELAEMISDAIEVFTHESNIGISIDELPTIIMLEPNKFEIGYISLDGTLTYSEIVEELNDNAIYEIFAKSPYIQNDTSYETFTVADSLDNDNKVNIIHKQEFFDNVGKCSGKNRIKNGIYRLIFKPFISRYCREI